MGQDEIPAVHDLIPFDLALRVIFQRIYVREFATALALRAHINGLAHVVSALVPLYAYTVEQGGVRRLRAPELKGALFGEGGKIVHFLDGRPEVRNLAVTSQAINTAITALAASA